MAGDGAPGGHPLIFRFSEPATNVRTGFPTRKLHLAVENPQPRQLWHKAKAHALSFPFEIVLTPPVDL